MTRMGQVGVDGLRALVVDDDDILRFALLDTLSTFGGIEVVGDAATAEDAIELAREHRPDVVLIDLRMPGIGGLEGARQIRQLLPAAAILVVTAYADAEFRTAAAECGADGYVVKGASFDSIVSAIEDAIRRRRAAPG